MTSASRLRPPTEWQRRLLMPRLTRPDGWLLAAVAGLAGLGVVMVFNVSYFYAQEHYGDPFLFFRKHLASLLLGGMALFLASRLRLDVLERWANVLLLLNVLALLLVLIPGIGTERGGARRWLIVGGFSLQPSELAKVAIVLFLARWLSRNRERVRDFRFLAQPLVVVGACAGLVLLQPDFGSAVIFSALLFLMLYVGGARSSHLLALGSAGAVALGLLATVAEYRMRRLLCFLDPWADSQGCGFQLVQSLIAVGSGGVAGVGLGQSRQKMFFLPEAHTDFIFALVGEELGLCGVALVVLLFALVTARGFRVASRHPDMFAGLLAFGLTLVVVLGAVVNVGVVLGLLPTKGLPLPFVSYGGSAMLGAMLSAGMLVALSRMTG
jgi:cell division protein FtsW